jgi:hypothetical protein
MISAISDLRSSASVDFIGKNNSRVITNDKNINKKNFLLAEKFFGFAEKTEKFL